MIQQFLLDHLIEGLVLTSFGALTFLVRAYFSSIQKAIERLAGRFDALDDRSDKHHTEIAVIRSELKALWRTIDPPLRTSDYRNGGSEE